MEFPNTRAKEEREGRKTGRKKEERRKERTEEEENSDNCYSV